MPKQTRPKVNKASSNTKPETDTQKPSDDNRLTKVELRIPDGSSEIICEIRPEVGEPDTSMMIFTHGAAGNNSTPSVANFADGFVLACQAVLESDDDLGEFPLGLAICFQGNSNVKSRTSMFLKVMDWCTEPSMMNHQNHKVSVFGGRSMGARAAVMAANTLRAEADESKHVKKLILSSYPLQGKNDVRDQILLDISDDIEVLFISGDKDNMCDLEKLEGVREKMNARSWLLTVEGANHSLDCKVKKKTKEMHTLLGRIAAEWAMGRDVKTARGDVGNMVECKITMSQPVNVEKKSKSKAKPETSKRKREAAAESETAVEKSTTKRPKRKAK